MSRRLEQCFCEDHARGPSLTKKEQSGTLRLHSLTTIVNPNRTPLVLIEEAIQLLRSAPVTVYALYCAGTVPFMLALFSFCAEMSYSRNAADNCAASAVIVALTYGWMKGLQAFCLPGTRPRLHRRCPQMVETRHHAGDLDQANRISTVRIFY